jgi:hypothetical protein
MFEHFDQIASKAKVMMLQKMRSLASLDKKVFTKVESYCSAISIVGFNSGFCDINLLANEGFINEIISRDKTLLS